MEIDVKIERIENGYIVTGNDSAETKMFYPSLATFAECQIIEYLRDRDKSIREHSVSKKSFNMKFTCDL